MQPACRQQHQRGTVVHEPWPPNSQLTVPLHTDKRSTPGTCALSQGSSVLGHSKAEWHCILGCHWQLCSHLISQRPAVTVRMSCTSPRELSEALGPGINPFCWSAKPTCRRELRRRKRDSGSSWGRKVENCWASAGHNALCQRMGHPWSPRSGVLVSELCQAPA